MFDFVNYFEIFLLEKKNMKDFKSTVHQGSMLIDFPHHIFIMWPHLIAKPGVLIMKFVNHDFKENCLFELEFQSKRQE